MEIMTLLKAGIKSKKGSFISTLLLTLLIVTIAAAVLGVRGNMFDAVDEADDSLGVGDLNVYVANTFYTDQMKQSIKDCAAVKGFNDCDNVMNYGKVYMGGSEYSNTLFFGKADDGIRLYNSAADGYESSVTPLKSGEIYLPFGLSETAKLGDEVKVEFVDKSRTFKVAGFVCEPMIGAQFIGWKRVFISDADYDALSAEVAPYESDTFTSYIKLVRIFKADSGQTDLIFQRDVNKATGIVTKSVGSTTRAESQNYTTLLGNITTGVMLGFVLLLFVIVLVMIAHGIKTEIDTDHTDLGVLKSQGFTNKALTRVIALRYLSAQLAAAVIGVLVSYPLERYISGIYMTNTGILPKNSPAFWQVGALVAVMLLLSALMILLMTRRLARISPVTAISGGKGEVYFSSRLAMPISGKALMPSIAVRCITSDIKRYIGLILITALLAFFVVTANIMSGALDTRSSLEAMGTSFADLQVSGLDEETFSKLDEIEEEIQKHSEIEKHIHYSHYYVSIDGVQILCIADMYPEESVSLLRGRLARYDNEIIITELAAEQLGLKIGDEVMVSGKRKESRYIITGTFQTMSDAGIAIEMPFASAKKIGLKNVSVLSWSLADEQGAKAAAKALNEKYEGKLKAVYIDVGEDLYNDTMLFTARVMKIMVYVFSGVFALVSVIMVCTKAFLQERTDIGIYKALGFTSLRLRTQFMVRYFLVSLIGSALGGLMGRLFSLKVLELIFRLFGICKLKNTPSALSYIYAALFICGCVAAFSFLASRRVKRVEVRELIVE